MLWLVSIMVYRFRIFLGPVLFKLINVQHFLKVYTILSAAIVATTCGVLFQLNNMMFVAPVSGITSILFISSLQLNKGKETNTGIRIMMLLVSGFNLGQTLVPLIRFICCVDVKMLCAIFVITFVANVIIGRYVAVYQPGGLHQWLYNSGVFLNAIVTLILISFLGSEIDVSQKYIAITVLGAFVMYDMSFMCRYHTSNRDSVEDAVDVFFHLFRMFTRLLEISDKLSKRRAGWRM